jgi:hypothetical protein
MLEVQRGRVILKYIFKCSYCQSILASRDGESFEDFAAKVFCHHYLAHLDRFVKIGLRMNHPPQGDWEQLHD